MRLELDRLDAIILAFTGGAAVLALSAWLYHAETLTAAFTALAGATLVVDFSWIMQKKAWRREVIVEMTDKTYGPLHTENRKNLQILMDPQTGPYFGLVDEVWKGILSDYRHLVISQDVARLLENFYGLLQVLRERQRGLGEEISNILMKNSGTALGATLQAVNWDAVAYRENGTSLSVALPNSAMVLNGWTLDDAVRMMEPKYVRFDVNVSAQRAGQSQMPTEPVDASKAKKVFEDSSLELKNTEAYKDFIRDKQELKALGVQIRARLQVILKQPWRV